MDGASKKHVLVIRDCLLLLSMPFLFWTTSLSVYEWLLEEDELRAMVIHERLLFGLQIAFAAIVIGLVWYRGMSVGWPISMFLFAMIWFGCLPVGVVSETTLREQLELQKYFEFSRRTIVFGVFSGIQILGYPAAFLSNYVDSVRNRFSTSPDSDDPNSENSTNLFRSRL